MVRTGIANFTGEIQRFLNRKTNIVQKCKISSCLIKDFPLKKNNGTKQFLYYEFTGLVRSFC